MLDQKKHSEDWSSHLPHHQQQVNGQAGRVTFASSMIKRKMQGWLKMDYRLTTICSLMGRINGFENLDLKVQVRQLDTLKILDDCVRRSQSLYLER